MDIDRRNDRDRWQRTPDAERLTRLDRAHRDTETKQTATRATAANHGDRWTQREDARLLADDAPPHHVLAAELGRSLYAVKARIRSLEGRHGTLQAHVGYFENSMPAQAIAFASQRLRDQRCLAAPSREWTDEGMKLTTRIAVMSDSHGNIVATRAVLAAAEISFDP